MPKTVFRFHFYKDGQILFLTDESEEHAREILRQFRKKRIKSVLFCVNGRLAGVSVQTILSREEILDIIVCQELG